MYAASADVLVDRRRLPYPRLMPGQAISAAQGEAVLAEAVSASRHALGPRLVAAYALGSLAHGGFSPLVSDVDLGLILADPLMETDEATIHQ